MHHVLTTKLAKLLNLQLVLLRLLVARRHIIALIAIRAGKRNIVTHLSNSRLTVRLAKKTPAGCFPQGTLSR